VSDKDRVLFIGVTPEPLFPGLMAHLNDQLLQFMGGYDVPNKRGALCKLSIGLQFSNGSNNGFGFNYGTKSKGPPREIAKFIREAVSLAEPWFEAQKKMSPQKEVSTGEKKPWRKVW
jgi:hypothetical protein